jgi:hypothetical protein
VPRNYEPIIKEVKDGEGEGTCVHKLKGLICLKAYISHKVMGKFNVISIKNVIFFIEIEKNPKIHMKPYTQTQNQNIPKNFGPKEQRGVHHIT